MHSYTSVMEAASRPVTHQMEVLLVLNEHESHTNSGYQATLATAVCTVTPSTCGSLVEPASCHPSGTYNFVVTQIFGKSINV